MKKCVALFLCLLLACLSVSVAFAATKFEYSSDQTEDLLAWSLPAQSDGNAWHLTWTSHNLGTGSGKCRAVVRIFAGKGIYASAQYLYSSPSEAYHDYNPGYGQGKKDTYIGGRKDNRDSGKLTVSGTFYN